MLDLNQLPGVIAVGSGAALSLINLHLSNVAYKVGAGRREGGKGCLSLPDV